jgi:hypothetical protein
MEIEIRPEILEHLKTPLSWALIEIISIILFLVCIVDAYQKNEENQRLFRIFELFGYVLYAGVFENIGVLLKIYDYSLDRLLLFGVVPLEILLLEAAIFYAAMRFAEQRNLPKWTIPFVVGVLCVLQDLTIDPVAVYNLQPINGTFEGQWNWTLHYEDTLFGIPYFNYSGWFWMMFYYTGLVLIGRHYHEKSGFKFKIGIVYVFLVPLLSIILIASPLTNFLLFAQPIVEIFNRTAEIIMLSITMSISGVIMIKEWKAKEKIDMKEEKIIWGIPLFLHILDVIYAFALQITIAYIPVILFGMIHMIYIGFYLSRKSINGENKNG